VRTLDWAEAHVGFDKVVDGLPAAKRGVRPEGFEYSAWQLLEHMRLAQKDLLAFCADAAYVHTLTWPDDYWPKAPAPPDAGAWDRSVSDFKQDRTALKELCANPAIDLFAAVPTGKSRQTYLRAVLLVIDHNAYHLGQLVAVRKALDAWS
jgi:hypothetical protein